MKLSVSIAALPPSGRGSPLPPSPALLGGRSSPAPSPTAGGRVSPSVLKPEKSLRTSRSWSGAVRPLRGPASTSARVQLPAIHSHGATTHGQHGQHGHSRGGGIVHHQRGLGASASASWAHLPRERDISTPAPPHVYGDNHSIFEDAVSPAKMPHFKDASRSAVFGSSPRLFEDSLLGAARRERVLIDEKRDCRGEAFSTRKMTGNRTAFYSGLAPALREHTDGVVRWDQDAGDSIRRRKQRIPEKKPSVPGSTLDRQRMRTQRREAAAAAAAAAAMGQLPAETFLAGVAGDLATTSFTPARAPALRRASRRASAEDGTTSILHGVSYHQTEISAPNMIFHAHPELMRLRTPAKQMIEQGARVAAGHKSTF